MPWTHGHPCVAIRVPLLAAGPGITKQTLCTDSDSLSQGDAYAKMEKLRRQLNTCCLV